MINPDIHSSNENASTNFKKLIIDKLSILTLNCHNIRNQSKKALLQSIIEELRPFCDELWRFLNNFKNL